MAEATNPEGSKQGFHADLAPPTDRDIPRNVRWREPRWLVFILCTAVIFGIPTKLVGYWGFLLGAPLLGHYIGGCIGGAFYAWILFKRLLVYVPEWQSQVTQNLITGDMIPYGPGLHPRFFWEQTSRDDAYPLTATPADFDLPQVKTLTSSIRLIGKGEFAISLPNIPRAIAVTESEEGVERAFLAFPKSALTTWCAGQKAEEIPGKLDDLNRYLSKQFVDEMVQDNHTPSFETQYGFRAVSIVVEQALLPEDVQATENSLSEAPTIRKIVEALYGLGEDGLAKRVEAGELTIEQCNNMLNRAMAISKQDTKMNIQVIEGNLSDAVANFLTRGSGGKGKGGK